MQAAADALYATPLDTELLSAALKAAAAMARNLPPLATGLMRAHVAHLRPAEAPAPTGADPVDQLPESLQLLFEVAVKLQGAAGGEGGDAGVRARRNAANAAIGLLSDLAVNSADVRVVLQGAQAAEAWTGKPHLPLALLAFALMRLAELAPWCRVRCPHEFGIETAWSPVHGGWLSWGRRMTPTSHRSRCNSRRAWGLPASMPGASMHQALAAIQIMRAVCCLLGPGPPASMPGLMQRPS